MKVLRRAGAGAVLLASLACVPVVSGGAVATASPSAPATVRTIPANELPSGAEQAAIQAKVAAAAATVKEGQTTLAATYRGSSAYVSKTNGVVQLQVRKAAGAAVQPRLLGFSFCEDIEVPAVLAAIAAAGGALAVLTGGIALPEYGVVITAAQLQAAAAGTSLVNALYNLVKAQVC